MTKSRWLSLFVLCALIVSIIRIGIVAATFDADKHREDIASVLSAQLGEPVKLNEPIKLQLSMPHGLELVTGGVVIENPSGAIQPVMAKIGQLRLGVRFLPLLDDRLSIKSFMASDADFIIDAYIFSRKKYAPSLKDQSARSGDVTARLTQIGIADSRISLDDGNDIWPFLTLRELSLSSKISGMLLRIDGHSGDVPINSSVAGGALTHLMKTKWPFAADLLFGKYHLQARGDLSKDGDNINFHQYLLSAGATNIHGKMEIALNGDRPYFQGTVVSNRFDPADFIPDKTAIPDSGSSPYFFSSTPFDFAAFKSFNAKLGIAIDELPLRRLLFSDVTATFGLNNGQLLVGPIKAMLANSPVDSNFSINASVKPTQANLLFIAPDLELSRLLPLGGAEFFLAGKTSARISLKSSGESMHDFAGNASGQIDVIAAGSAITDAAMDSISTMLTNIVTPGNGNVHSNAKCLSAHFTLDHGTGHADRLFMDTGFLTMIGAGQFNLHDESVDLMLRAKKGQIDIGAVAPTLRVSGPIMNLSFTSNAPDIAQNAADLINGGSPDDAEDKQANAEEKSCTDTLDHKNALTAASNDVGLVQIWAMKLRDRLENLGSDFRNVLGQ